ncbi:MAG: extracellular solute-binding protein [Clostridia bacterium]|nr:extracellular solute-binding protein [Clostridia bacterium]
MRKRATRALAMLLCLIMVCATIAIPVSAASTGSSTGNKVSISDVSEILNAISYTKYRDSIPSLKVGNKEVPLDIFNYEYKYTGTAPSTDITKDYNGEENTLYIPEKGTVTWSFQIPEGGTGNYTIEIEYCHATSKANSIERIFYINGEVPFSEARSIVLSKVWEYQYLTDDKGNIVYNENGQPMFDIDNNGNDIRPVVGIVSDPNKKWVTYAISDSNGYEIHPFQFYFEEGANTISMESQREPVIIRSIKLVPYNNLPSYESYIQQILNKVGGTLESNRVTEQMIKDAINKGNIIIEAEAPDRVSAVTMYPVYDRTSSITSGVTGPQSAVVTKYNTAGKEQWQNVGEWMTYTFKAPATGFYSISVRYKQALLSGMFVSRRLYINGEIPFEEANNCRFPFADQWQTIFLGDGNKTFEFYFEEGKEYELKLEAVLGEEMGAEIEKVNEALSVINNCYLEILKLTGSDPDANRDYDFARVMPGVMRDMFDQFVNLKGVYTRMVASSGKGEKTSTIEQVYLLLEKMAKDEKQIPGNLQTLKSNIGSLGTWVNSAKTQPLQVDLYSVQSIDSAVPQGSSGFFASLWYEIQLFFASFTIDYNDLGGGSEEGVVGEDHKVDVWVATGRDQAQIIRNLIDNNFSQVAGHEGIKVSLKLISGGTLLPSVLAGSGPDVALMESSTMIIDYALRDAVYPLNEFIEKDTVYDEKGNVVSSPLDAFPDAAMIPLTLHDYDMKTDTTYKNYYGLPDSLTFPMMFYRKDVLASLELSVPETWDDMLSILPVLQYNNMEIGIQNDIYTFIYQSGNEAYSNKGMSINFDDQGVLNAFTKMCNMYTQYSLPYTFDFANRFRTGEMPIGIAPYTTCNQLAVFASELSGLWTFVPMPGYELTNEDGETYINNCAIATVTGCLMLNGCDNREDTWKFMKWYTAKDFQVAYSNEIVSIMGIAARPATANSEAIRELPWTTEEADNILAQFENLTAVENHPGSYYLARYISFAFLAAYNEGKDPADALLSYVNTINAEIERRREEFKNDVADDDPNKRYMYTVAELDAYLLAEGTDSYEAFLDNLAKDEAKYNEYVKTSQIYERYLEKQEEYVTSSEYESYLEALASNQAEFEKYKKESRMYARYLELVVNVED